MLSHFEFNGEVKEGSYGRVFFAMDKRDSNRVAIKFNETYTPESEVRFELENRILNEFLEHNGVVNVHTEVLTDVHERMNKQYYVMERADSVMHDLTFDDDYSQGNKLRNLIDVAETLKSIHDGKYVHRDLHIHNVLMFFNDDGEWDIKLSDFGRAYSAVNPLDLSKSPAWGDVIMPPEVRFGLVGKDDFDLYRKTDFYALGILIQYLLIQGLETDTRLRAMPNDIFTFMSEKINDRDYRNYLTLRSDEDRKSDYLEWCSLYQEKFENLYFIDDINENKSEILTYIVANLSNVNYELRHGDLDATIADLKGL